MTILVRDTTVVTGNHQRTVLYNAGIAIDGNRIVDLGPTEDVESRHQSADIIEGRGGVIFPGLINCHTHLQATADKGILEDFGFPTKLRFPTTGRGLLNTEERNVFGLLACIEAIRSGTTTLLEISNDIHEYAESLNSTGLRWMLGENINDIDGAKARDGKFEFLDSKRETALQRSADLIESWHGKSDGRVLGFVAPHAPETVSPELLRSSREMAERYDVGYTIHLSQSYEEIEAIMRTRGVMPTHYLFANDFLGDRLVAAHCRYVNSAEIALLGQTDSAVSHNAAIGARRGAAAPVKELLAAGCAVGMGSDNMAEDMVEVMRAGLFHERVRRNDEMNPQPEDALEWATYGGARTLGISDDVGMLEIGKKADLFMVNVRRAHLVPTLRIVSAFVHNGLPSDITDVMVDGNWLLRDSKLLTIDEDDIIARAEEIGHRAWNRLIDENPNVPFPINLP
ncbi:MAG: amidohydrolase family protein, partial [SAR202 cluster bacterium]|nr:amidohydrolase family protein [SAR202 cluster bacterium]